MPGKGIRKPSADLTQTNTGMAAVAAAARWLPTPLPPPLLSHHLPLPKASIYIPFIVSNYETLDIRKHP